MGDIIFSNLTKLFSWIVFFVLLCVLFSLFAASYPAIKHFGFHFLTSQAWDPVHNNFGALSAITGTLLTSTLAIVIAVPASIGIAIFISEIASKKSARFIRLMIDLMAGIPSIIYGMWGLLVLAPFLSNNVQPQISELVKDVPVLNILFEGPPLGIGIFTAGIILSIMIIPYIASTSVELFRSVPVVLKESAYGIGATRLEVVRHIVIPHVRQGVIGSMMLGLGRALGETMAVTFVIGNSKTITSSLFMPGTTISATIANEFNEAQGTLYSSSLLELGVILFLISFAVLAAARLFLLTKKQRESS